MGLKISKIEKLDITEPAYDVSVESDNHTFELSNGVFVHNCMKVPKQFFGDTDDSAGFDGGTSLSIISSRYAKTIKRLQNSVIQALTDALNLMLIDKGLDSYVNKFTIKMLPPTTREELDRRDNLSNKVGVASDIMNLLSEIENPVTKLKVMKSLVSEFITDPEIIDAIDEEIKHMESGEANAYESGMDDDSDFGGDMGSGFGGNAGGMFDGGLGGDIGDMPNEEEMPRDNATSSELPSIESTGVDMTDSTNPDFE